MKVLLTAINSQYVHSNLAIRYLRAYTKDLNYECKLREFTINDRKERVLNQIMEEKADVVVFSCYIWNIEYVTALSKLIRLINKDIKIVIGGPEVSFNSEYLLQDKIADVLILGEGEETYRELMEAFIENKNILEEIKGISYIDGENIVFTGHREIMDMNKVVFPYEEDDDLDNRIVYYEASRGCPFRCKYCLSSVDRKVRFLPIERVKRELQYFIDKKVKLVKFVDRTFNCKIDFAMEIWEFLIEADTETKFHFEISADLMKKEAIEILAKAPKNRFQFEVGVQTTNNEILRNINRHVNFETIAEKVQEVENLNNIMQHLDLIAGLPGEDFESFRKSFNDVHSIAPEEIQLGFLKIIKGSPMYDEAEKWGMKYSPYPPYEILCTNKISYEELMILKRVEEVVDKYYNSGKFKNILKYFKDDFEEAFDFYLALGNFFYEKGYLNRNISSQEYYKVFLDFNEEVLHKENYLLKEIIKYDYLMFNKKKWLPPFLDRTMDKEEEREVRERVKSIELDIKKNNIHVEKYNINIIKLIKEGVLENKIQYLIYDIKDDSKVEILN